MNRDAVKSKIRKLLGLANDPNAAEGEIENALRFSERLMAQHQIDQGELDQHEARPAKSMMANDRAWLKSSRAAFWQGQLSMVVCRAVGTVQTYQDYNEAKLGPGGTVAFNENGEPDLTKYAGFRFYGPAADVSLAVEMFAALSETISAMGVLRYGSCVRGSGRNYCEGFVSGLRDSLMQQQAGRDSHSKALVLARTDVVKREATKWLQEEHGIKTYSKSSGGGASSYDGKAFGSGAADGRAHGMKTGGRGRLGSRPRLQLA